MKIYNYSALTNEFLSESVADESPLEEGVFLIPAYATTIEPPEVIEGKIRVFIDGEWEYVDVETFTQNINNEETTEEFSNISTPNIELTISGLHQTILNQENEMTILKDKLAQLESLINSVTNK